MLYFSCIESTIRHEQLMNRCDTSPLILYEIRGSVLMKTIFMIFSY